MAQYETQHKKAKNCEASSIKPNKLKKEKLYQKNQTTD